MRLPDFFTKKKADETADELAARLAKAEEAHASAKERAAKAQATLDAERSAAALQDYREAKQELSDVEDMVSIVRDNHTTAVAREAAAERARQAAKLEELDRVLTYDAVLAATRDVAEREADLVRRLAECRADRRKLRSDFKELERQRFTIALKLDHSVKATWNEVTAADAAISHDAVRAALAQQEAPSGLVASFLRELKPTGNSYWPDQDEVHSLS